MQEAYLQVYCLLRSSGPAGHAPAALLYTIARNIAFSRRRHLKVVTAAKPAIAVGEELRRDEVCIEQQASRKQRMQRLLRVVNGLPPRCRDVFVLRMIEGLSQRDIADRLGIAVSTVEKHLARGLHHCKEELTRLESVPVAAESQFTAASARVRAS